MIIETMTPNKNAKDPWEAHNFDGIEKTARDLGKVFRHFFGDDSCSSIPAVGMHTAFLPYNYYVEENVKQDGSHGPLKHVFKIACAGYAKENIKVSRKDNVLNVVFEQPQSVTEEGQFENEDGTKTVRLIKHNGLTARSGKISWVIKNFANADVKSCAVKNGILTITIQEREPVDNSETIEISAE